MTKKTIIYAVLLVSLLTLCVSFYSCEKDGVFNPKQKISRVYEDLSFYSVVLHEEIIYPKQLVQDWTWDKNKLNKINFWGFSSHWGEEPTLRIWNTDRYFYEKNKLVRIEQDGGYCSKIFYNGSKLDKIKSYNREQELWQTMSFFYDKNKITRIKIEVIPSYWDKKMEKKLLSTFIPKEFVSKIVEKSEKNRSKDANAIIYNVAYTYNGDNIDKTVFVCDARGYEMNTIINYISYDNKNNPLYKKMKEIDIEEEMHLGTSVVSPKNNPLEVKVNSTKTYNGVVINEEIIKCTYTYTYSKDYPIVIEAKMIYEDDEYDDDDDDVEITKRYFEYK